MVAVAALRTEVVQSIENDIERLEPRHVELSIFDVGVDRVYSDMGIKCRCGVCGNLSISVFHECYASHMCPMGHTKDLLCFTSFLRKRNWRFRFDRSMVSRSKRVISPNPVITTFFTDEPNKRISTRKSDERHPRAGSRRVGRVKAETHVVHIRSHQLRRAKYAY